MTESLILGRQNEEREADTAPQASKVRNPLLELGCGFEYSVRGMLVQCVSMMEGMVTFESETGQRFEESVEDVMRTGRFEDSEITLVKRSEPVARPDLFANLRLGKP